MFVYFKVVGTAPGNVWDSAAVNDADLVLKVIDQPGELPQVYKDRDGHVIQLEFAARKR